MLNQVQQETSNNSQTRQSVRIGKIGLSLAERRAEMKILKGLSSRRDSNNSSQQSLRHNFTSTRKERISEPVQYHGLTTEEDDEEIAVVSVLPNNQ